MRRQSTRLMRKRNSLARPTTNLLLEALEDRFLPAAGLMLGLGETATEVEQVLRDLRGAGVDCVTLGQYLRPTLRHLPVARYLDPAEFDGFARAARELGFLHVASGPLVRSSFHAGEVHALVGALAEGRDAETPLRVGSVKSNLGHLESAAGATGLLKVALSLAHKEIPPQLHFRNWNRKKSGKLLHNAIRDNCHRLIEGSR